MFLGSPRQIWVTVLKCFHCVKCLIVVQMPQGKNPFTVRTKLNPVALFRERTIPTKLLLLVSKCQLLWIEGVVWSTQLIPTAVFLLFYTISSK
jgi:hypothetical protein